jgi:hypothetical protein
MMLGVLEDGLKTTWLKTIEDQTERHHNEKVERCH